MFEIPAHKDIGMPDCRQGDMEGISERARSNNPMLNISMGQVGGIRSPSRTRSPRIRTLGRMHRLGMSKRAIARRLKVDKKLVAKSINWWEQKA